MPFLSLHSSPLLTLPHPIRFAALAHFLHQQNNKNEERGNRPPQPKAELPHQLGDSRAFAEPLEQTPNIGSAGDSKDPGNRARCPERSALRLALAHFLQAKLNAKLRPARESGGEGKRRGAQRAQRSSRTRANACRANRVRPAKFLRRAPWQSFVWRVHDLDRSCGTSL